MIRPPEMPRFCRFLAFMLIFLFCTPLQAAQSPETLQADFLRLKTKFEQDIQKVKEQTVLTTMALESTAQAWALAALYLDAEAGEIAVKKAALQKAMAGKNWEARELAALEYYYEAVLALAKKRARNNSQNPLVAELDSIAAKTAQEVAGLKAKPEADLEKRVVLSGALASIMAVAVKSVGGGAMEQPTQLIVKEMLAKARAVSERPDIHYRAKLSLLYANHAQGLTALIFLLGHNAGPPLSHELAKVHNAWNSHLREASLPDTLSLTWTAQGQAVLPLAFWLATH